MKNILLGLILVMSLYACDKEDWLHNDLPERNFFEIPEDATDEESVLRREFAERNGVYLLFNDTLGYQDVTGVSGGKVRKYELLRLGYDMLSGSQADTFVFSFYTTLVEKRSIAEFVEEEVLKNVPALFHPYSVLLVKDMERIDEYEYSEELSVYSGMKATAIALGDILGLSSEEKLTLKNALIQEMIIRKISSVPDMEFSVFYSYSQEYYGISTSQVPVPIQNVGFLENYYYDFWKTFNTKQYDLLAYLEEIFRLSETEFRDIYAEYPIVIEKMEEMVKVLRKYGVNVYL